MTLTVRLPETIDIQLTSACESLGLSKSHIVQSALKDWFAKPLVSGAHPLLAFVQTATGLPDDPSDNIKKQSCLPHTDGGLKPILSKKPGQPANWTAAA